MAHPAEAPTPRSKHDCVDLMTNPPKMESSCGRSSVGRALASQTSAATDVVAADSHVGFENRELDVADPQIIRGLPNDIYHRRKELSKSPAWAFRHHGPVWFYEQYVARTGTPFTSDALARGTLIHLVFELGYEAFWAAAVRIPEPYLTSNGSLSQGKEAKAWRADQPADAVLVSPADAAVIDGIWRQAQDNSIVRDLIERQEEHELSVIGNIAGHPARCRIDMLTHDGQMVDWKTCRDARPLETWFKTVLEHGYHYQSAWYEHLAEQAGLSDRPMVFVALSTVPSYQVQAVTLPRELVARCHEWIAADLDEIALRTEMGNWLPDGYGEITELKFPGWALKEDRHG